MIVSHKHKFIFIKPQKTAGTSVELLLSRCCGDEDIITPLGFDPDPDVRKKNNARDPQNFYRPKPLKNWELRELYWLLRKGIQPNLNYWEHLTADKIRQYVGPEVWNEYLKLSIVRNPWDHAVSMYEWMSKYGYGGVKKDAFRDFVVDKYKEMWPFFSTKGVYCVDIMLRFESLHEGLQGLEKRIPGLDISRLPVTKNKVRGENDYTKYYDEYTREIIRQKNLNVLELFNYTFN